MKALKTLFKVQKYKVDQILKRIKELEKQLEEKNRELLELQKNEKLEIEKCSKVQFMSHLESYLNYNRQQQVRCVSLIAAIDDNLARERAFLNEQFSEMKKIDIVLQEKMKEQKLEEDYAELLSQDEVNITRYIYEKPKS